MTTFSILILVLWILSLVSFLGLTIWTWKIMPSMGMIYNDLWGRMLSPLFVALLFSVPSWLAWNAVVPLFWANAPHLSLTQSLCAVFLLKMISMINTDILSSVKDILTKK